MATIRKRNGKYEVQVRRTGQSHLSRTFVEHKDAKVWARQMEIAADRHDLPTIVDKRKMSLTLGALVHRYKDTVTVRKRASENERIALSAFALHPICRKTLSELRPSDFAEYRDERLRTVKPISLKREFSTIHNLFEVARDEWGIPLKENPLAKLKLEAPDQRRERRLKDGEYERLMQAAGRCRNKLISPIVVLRQWRTEQPSHSTICRAWIQGSARHKRLHTSSRPCRLHQTTRTSTSLAYQGNF
jgi:hypothetical protein